MKTALYSHDLAINPRQLFVLRENADKTVDLGKIVVEKQGEKEVKKTVLVVGSCPMSDVRKVGHCVIEAEAPVVPEVDPKK